MVELTSFSHFPHTIQVATTVREALGSLARLTAEMDRRYELFQKHAVKNIQHYWKKTGNSSLPYMVVFIDELADLMLMAKQKDAEEDLPGAEHSITRLTQKARAAGIHLVIATQRPSVDVITGVIKANLPSRISFYLKSQHDYRTILDEVPSFELMGKGDGLAIIEGQRGRIRFQGACIAKDDIQTEATISKLEDFWNSGKNKPSTEMPSPEQNMHTVALKNNCLPLQNQISRVGQLNSGDQEFQEINRNGPVALSPNPPEEEIMHPNLDLNQSLLTYGGQMKPIVPPKGTVLLPNLFNLSPDQEVITPETPATLPDQETEDEESRSARTETPQEELDDLERLKYLMAQTWAEAYEANPGKNIKAPSISVTRKLLKIGQERIVQLYGQLVEEKWLQAPPKSGVPYFIVADPKECQSVLQGGTEEE